MSLTPARVREVALAVLASATAGVALVASTSGGGGGRQLLGLAVVAVAGIAVVFVVFAHLPVGTVCLWVVLTGPLYPFLNLSAGGRTIATFDRVAVVGMAAWLLLSPAKRSQAPATRFLTTALVGLAVAYGLRAAATDLSAVSNWFDAIMLPAIVYSVVMRFGGDPAFQSRLAASVTIAGGLLATIGIAERFGGFELASRTAGSVRFDTAIDSVRISGPYSVPETYALALLVCLGLTLYWIQLPAVRRSPYAVMGLMAAALELSALSLTFFRAAWIGAFFVLVAAFGVRPGRGSRLIVTGLVAGSLAGFAFTQLSDSQTFETRVNSTDNVQTRFATYLTATKVWTQAPLFGVGVGRFGEAYDRVPDVTVAGVAARPSPHSSFFGILAEQGIVGFFALLGVVAAVWRLIGSLRRTVIDERDGILVGAMVGVGAATLVMSLTLSMLPYAPSNLFLAVAIGMLAARANAIAR